MRRTAITLFAAFLSFTAMAQTVALKSEGREEGYVNTIVQRAEKNIAALKLTGEKALNVRNIVANKYFELNDIYTERDKAIALAKDSLSGAAKNAAIDMAKAQCDSRLYRSHFAFPSTLAKFLSADEVTAVEDAMTYNKVKVTYDAYLDEIPSLKDEEKVQIYAWLVEARHLAIDAEGSKQKHEVFNKYKGRINNYLSKRGYDLNKEREAWFKRLEERKKQEKK